MASACALKTAGWLRFKCLPQKPLCFLFFHKNLSAQSFFSFVLLIVPHQPRRGEQKFEGGKHSMSKRKEGRKWRENTNQKAPDGFSRLEVFEKAATKKDDHNHPNSLQRVNYRNENINIIGNMVKSCMIRAHNIILEQISSILAHKIMM